MSSTKVSSTTPVNTPNLCNKKCILTGFLLISIIALTLIGSLSAHGIRSPAGAFGNLGKKLGWEGTLGIFITDLIAFVSLCCILRKRVNYGLEILGKISPGSHRITVKFFDNHDKILLDLTKIGTKNEDFLINPKELPKSFRKYELRCYDSEGREISVYPVYHHVY